MRFFNLFKPKRSMDDEIQEYLDNGAIVIDVRTEAEYADGHVPGSTNIVLDTIPVGDKAVLLMKYQDNMSIKEIATVLNKSESAIKMKLKRAKHKAQKVYEDKFKQD